MFRMVVLLAVCPALQVPAAEPETRRGAIDLAAGAQLFVDDVLVDRTENVWRTLHQPSKYRQNPVVKPDRPWEGFLALQPGTVIFDEQESLFKMWYNALATTQRPNIDEFLCYATSRDGLNWEKPELNLVEFEGSRANNIVLKHSNWTHSLIKDDLDPDLQRRYKLAYWQSHDRKRHGVWVAFSPDGLRWTDHPGNPVVPLGGSGDTFSVMRDPASKDYLMYHKTGIGPTRKVSLLVSRDFVKWEGSRQVLAPDLHDDPATEFYGLSAFPYGGQYLGMLWIFHQYTQLLDVQFASSRDSVNWERTANRRVFLPLGFMVLNYGGASFDSGMIYPASAPVEKDGQLWIYYSGFANLHSAPPQEHTGQIGLARLRKEGFCSMDATSEGYLVTRPLRLRGSSLTVNAEVLPIHARDVEAKPSWSGLFTGVDTKMGSLRVEVQDEKGQAIPGFEASHCEPLRGNEIAQKVVWQRGKTLSSLAGRAVRLKFVMANARLFSFRIE